MYSRVSELGDTMRANRDLRGRATRSLPVVSRKSAGKGRFVLFFTSIFCPPTSERSFSKQEQKKFEE